MTTGSGTGINYTFLGYDLGVYFIESLYKYGDKLCECAENTESNLLLSDYKLTRDRTSGINKNTSIRVIHYNREYIVEEIR